jgi:DNA-directed RNA polymerase subunit M/transcription elongation factor TFIIS
MNFCNSCGALIARMENNELVCSCGNRQAPASVSVNEKMAAQKELEVVDRSTHPLAVYDHVCSKCGYGKAQLVSKGVWITDEDEWVEYICGKCGHHDHEDGLKPT